MSKTETPTASYYDAMRAVGIQSGWQITPTAEHQQKVAEAEGHELFDQPGEALPGGHQMQYHGGPLISSPKLFVLWASGQSSYDKAQFAAFCKDLMESGYFDKIAPYTGGSFTGKYLGAADGPATAATFSEADGVAYVQAAIAAGIAPPADGSTVYSIMLPPGVTATLGKDANCAVFCAYHSSDGGKILFTVQPDSGCDGCHGNETPFQAACMVESHEVAELCTDPYGSGWYENSSGMENGDLVAWIPLQYGPFTVQGYFLNDNGGTNGIGTYHPAPVQQPPPQPSPACRAPAQQFAVTTMLAAIAGWNASDHSALSYAKWRGQYDGALAVYQADGELPV